MFRQRFARLLGKRIIATGYTDQFRYPADASNDRIVPFLEVNLGPSRQLRRGGAYLFQMRFGALRVTFGLFVCAHHRTEPPHVRDDAFNAAMIADPNLDTGVDQLARDISLDV